MQRGVKDVRVKPANMPKAILHFTTLRSHTLKKAEVSFFFLQLYPFFSFFSMARSPVRDELEGVVDITQHYGL